MHKNLIVNTLCYIKILLKYYLKPYNVIVNVIHKERIINTLLPSLCSIYLILN